MTQPQVPANQNVTTQGGQVTGSTELLLSTIAQGQTSLATSLEALRSENTQMRIDLSRMITHMERVDTRNESADQLHTDHESRIRTLEKLDADAIKETVGKLTDRISALEKFKWQMVGALVFLSAIAGVIEYFLLHVH